MSLCPWQILVVVVFVGPCPVCFLLCFSAGWRSAYLAGGSAFRLLWFVFVVFCAVDLPSYMTTGVNVDVILNCFFSCKDRASERDRPYHREKKDRRGGGGISRHSEQCVILANFVILYCVILKSKRHRNSLFLFCSGSPQFNFFVGECGNIIFRWTTP